MPTKYLNVNEENLKKLISEGKSRIDISEILNAPLTTINSRMQKFKLNTSPYRKYDTKYLINKKFGRLTILKELPSITYTTNRSIKRLVLCKCDCGNEIEVRLSELTRGSKISCKCTLKEFLSSRNTNKSNNWAGHGEINSTYFTTLLKNAKKRKIEFNITIEEIWELFLKQNRKCALSGLDLKFKSRARISDGTASLDRIDSSKGYVLGNVQWLHKYINKMKLNHSDKDFIYYCKLVANKNNKLI